ncbi:alpha/beta hydrolase [Parasphingorhabdus cellanae]|uniref:Alpha/beta hydrolase n=1 Tax=Parasphingorhabdus cellanae TaxID=2806553 RepID=A0ABX7T6S2_9SPHN|nr:alpha/beta hydrolase [Parasphingorhabdus cellanae]QTD57304.1 alpha/beta hydrolase [Parasphingorhabdus cellanae]
MQETEKTIEFDSDGVHLTGTLELPIVARPRGSILLLSGSGPQDRDETIAGKRPFRVLSKALVHEGFYVFRWDDRGVGESAGNYQAASASELAADVVRAMNRLVDETKFERQILLGHSQGTIIAANVAVNYPAKVAGIGLLAGIGLPGRQALLMQHEMVCRSEAWPEDEIAVSTQQKASLFDILIAACEDRLTSRLDRDKSQSLEEKLLAVLLDGIPISMFTPSEQQDIRYIVNDLMEWEWRFLLSTDPADDLSKIDCPIFAMTGDKDMQVDAVSNIDAIKKACFHGRALDVQTEVLEDHNHLFQQTKVGALSNYDSLGEPFSTIALSRIVEWLSQVQS